MFVINTNNINGRPTEQPQKKVNEDLVNEKIRFPEVLVISQDGNQKTRISSDLRTIVMIAIKKAFMFYLKQE